MEKIQVKFSNGLIYDLDQFSLPIHLVLPCKTQLDGFSIWQQLTPAALKKVTIMIDNEDAIRFDDCSTAGVQFVPQGNGLIMHIYLSGTREKFSQQELEYIRAAKIMLGEEE